MVNRANVEFYQRYDQESLSAILFVSDQGQPARMGADLERLVKQARAFMEEIGRLEEWNGESVASLLVIMAAREDGHGVMPRFLPSWWRDIEYVWRVYLGPKPGEYTIQCFRVTCSGPAGWMDDLEKVDWRREAGL